MPSSMSGRPASARSWRELAERVNELGFLPLFRNEVRGFSAEELTWGQPWWSGDPEEDPWYWRESIARSGAVAYGKFFAGKAGFLSLDWLPVFANWRRDGYETLTAHLLRPLRQPAPGRPPGPGPRCHRLLV